MSDDLATQMARMQAQIDAMKSGTESDDKLESIWAVHDPSKVQVWCSKIDCGLGGRKLSTQTIHLPVDHTISAALDGTDVEEDDPFERDDNGEVILDDDGEPKKRVVEVKVLRESGPTVKHHSLGIIASFTSERSAIKFVTDHYKRNQMVFSSMDPQDVPQLEVVEILITA